MKARIFIVNYASHTRGNEDCLYQSVKTFSGANYPQLEQEARNLYEQMKEQAYEECKWGEYWDVEDEEEREGAYEYSPLYANNDITRADFDGMLHGSYEVESEAYDGYKVSIEFEEREIEVPSGDIFLFDRKVFTEQEAKNMSKEDAVALAQVEKGLRHVWQYHPYCSTFESDWNGGSIDPANYIIRIIY